MGDGRWAMGDGRRAMDDGRWEMHDGRWAIASASWPGRLGARCCLSQRSRGLLVREAQPRRGADGTLSAVPCPKGRWPCSGPGVVRWCDTPSCWPSGISGEGLEVRVCTGRAVLPIAPFLRVELSSGEC
ncbi:hypothetical protein BD413DRAFT_579499 [Trametes elegans]|nr:hypothetical protein BD413DRAFT_579499 [Trametes elegans]